MPGLSQGRSRVRAAQTKLLSGPLFCFRPAKSEPRLALAGYWCQSHDRPLFSTSNSLTAFDNAVLPPPETAFVVIYRFIKYGRSHPTVGTRLPATRLALPGTIGYHWCPGVTDTPGWGSSDSDPAAAVGTVIRRVTEFGNGRLYPHRCRGAEMVNHITPGPGRREPMLNIES
jgi:hypothetical protein